jgi:hypothetical protein
MSQAAPLQAIEMVISPGIHHDKSLSNPWVTHEHVGCYTNSLDFIKHLWFQAPRIFSDLGYQTYSGFKHQTWESTMSFLSSSLDTSFFIGLVKRWDPAKEEAIKAAKLG